VYVYIFIEICTHIYIYIRLEFCYGVYNQHESFIYLDLMVKNRKISIDMYFKW
jgi:hypothetical protein